MINRITYLLFLLSITFALRKHNVVGSRMVRLKGLNGGYLHRNNQIPYGLDVQGGPNDRNSYWYMQYYGVNVKLVNVYNSIQYVTPCYVCRSHSAYPYSVLYNGNPDHDGDWLLWEEVPFSDGTTGFKSSLIRLFLAPCNGCASTNYSYVPFAHANQDSAWAHWQIQDVICQRVSDCF